MSCGSKHVQASGMVWIDCLLKNDNAASRFFDELCNSVSRFSFFHLQTTVKILSVDADIISALMLRYRCYHLQNVIDCDECGGIETIFKADHPTAMRRSVDDWTEVPVTVVINRLEHTGCLPSFLPLQLLQR